MDPVRRLGVAGWPVGHSRSPAMHEAALADLGLDGWTYQKLPIAPELFGEIVGELARLGFRGINVTIPHKEAALAVAARASDAARAIGAANTLTFGDDGAIAAENTDAPGLLAALPVPVAGRPALVLGAGGSARAAVWALRTAGAEVRVWNRTPERARALARELGATAVPEPVGDGVLVNCTAAGLGDEPQLEAIPVAPADLGAFDCVVDLVYRPEGTPLVEAAREGGVRAVDGLEVLARQGALSLELWTGRAAPLAVMREAARDGIIA